MNYWKHSLLSKKKFGGAPEDYLIVHRFMDASKLFYFDIRHRLLLHHTYGIGLCVQKFGDFIINSEGKKILVRDIAAEHCKEDLAGVVPTLTNWFRGADEQLHSLVQPIYPEDEVLKAFVWGPMLMSGLKSSLLITHSNFGVFLAGEVLGLDYALRLSELLSPVGVNEWLPMIKLNERWQYSPDLKQLNHLTDGTS